MRRLWLIGLIIVLLQPLHIAQAAPSNLFEFINVSPTSCNPGASVGINFNYSVAANENRTDNWTMQNPRAGTSATNTASPVIGGPSGHSFILGIWWMTIPAGTRAGDILRVVVSMVSTVGQSAIQSFGFNCATGQIFPESSAAPNENVTTWFDPGDTRVYGWAGDRIAVYCRTDKEIQVIGIGADGKGAGVIVFKTADVIAAGKQGLSLPLRSYKDAKVDLGVVSIQMTLNDGVTSIYIAWNGGILNATGQGDFKKLIIAPTRFCPFTFR